MTIRNAVADDLDALVALNGEVQSIHVSPFPDVFRETEQAALRGWFEEQMANASTTVLVCVEKERAVAYLIMRTSRRDPHLFCCARNCAYVDQACVAAEFRRRGVASSSTARSRASS